MGCKNSKPRIQPVGPAEIAHDNINLKKCHSEVSEYDIDEQTGQKIRNKKSKKSKSAKSKRSLGSNVSLDDNRSLQESDRGNSATSKLSKFSADSGFGYDNEYAHVITENSALEQVRKIEKGFVPDDKLDLGISGRACSVRLSAKDKERLEESMIIQNLREEGLITKPQQKCLNGMSFEIIDATNATGAPMRPPPRLAKLERRRKKKKQLTEEEIREKLEKAERRKKKKELERLNKIKDLEKCNVNNALEQFEMNQRVMENEVHKKLDQVTDNREKRLQGIQDKIRRHQEHAAMVRKRKELAALEANLNEEEPSPQN